jgi:hypothetical protein
MQLNITIKVKLRTSEYYSEYEFTGHFRIILFCIFLKVDF